MKILDWVVIASGCLFAAIVLLGHVDASIQRHNALQARQDSIIAYLEQTMHRVDSVEIRLGYITGDW